MPFIKEIELTDKKKKALLKLSSLDEWMIFEGMVEELLQSQAFNLLAGNLTKEEKMDDLEDAEGGYRFWNRIKDLIEKSK